MAQDSQWLLPVYGFCQQASSSAHTPVDGWDQQPSRCMTAAKVKDRQLTPPSPHSSTWLHWALAQRMTVGHPGLLPR